jgi:hypothetical protein
MGVAMHAHPRQVAAAAFAGFLLLATPSAARHGTAAHSGPCTHGASSIGPVVFRDGKIASPEPAPHTEACLGAGAWKP